MLNSLIDYGINKVNKELEDLITEIDQSISEREESNSHLTEFAYEIGYAQECINKVEVAKKRLELLRGALTLITQANELSN